MDLVHPETSEGVAQVLGNVGHQLRSVGRNLLAVVLDLADLCGAGGKRAEGYGSRRAIDRCRAHMVTAMDGGRP